MHVEKMVSSFTHGQISDAIKLKTYFENEEKFRSLIISSSAKMDDYLIKLIMSNKINESDSEFLKSKKKVEKLSFGDKIREIEIYFEEQSKKDSI